MMLKPLFALALALLLLVAPAVFGSRLAPTRFSPATSDLVVSSIFGEKLDPVVRFPEGSHLKEIGYQDSSGPGGPYMVEVLYIIPSPRNFDDVVEFYQTRYPHHPTYTTQSPNREWSMYIGKGRPRTLLFTVTDTRVPTKHPSPYVPKGTSCLITSMVGLPPASIDRFKSANGGWLHFPLPQ